MKSVQRLAQLVKPAQGGDFLRVIGVSNLPSRSLSVQGYPRDTGPNPSPPDSSKQPHPDLYPPGSPINEPGVPKRDPDINPPDLPDTDPFPRDVNPDIHPPPFMDPNKNPVPAS